jgi:hypothetical protein
LPTNGTIVKKRGQKGFTIFGRCPGLVDKAFNINGARVCDVLANGRFCVLPGSIHPDTHKPYRWLTDDTLEDTDPSELPEYPADLVERIAAALAPFGYGAEPARPARPAQEYAGSSGGDIWKVLNDKSIANLDAWVPQIGLYKLRRTRDGYLAVATWRPSSSGRPVEQRNQNLGISHRGIKDFGDDRGYSPIDLVMAARGLDFGEAYGWLEQLVDPSDIVIALKPKIPTLKARDAAPIVANRSTKITVGSWGIKIGSWGIKMGKW